MKRKYCAYGTLYYDEKGETTEYDSDFVWIEKPWGKEVWNAAYVKLFNTKEERDKWIEEQNYRYDDR